MPNTTIALRSSGTTTSTPSLGVLANGELAINFADGIIYYKTSSNSLGSIRTTLPAGLTTEVQYNDAGSFGSNSNFTYNKTTKTLTVSGNIVVGSTDIGPTLAAAYNQANTDVTSVSVTGGTYGNATIVPVITVAANGRITAVSNVTITTSGSGATISVSDSPPGSPTANSLWWQSNTGVLKIYYNDGDSSQWVDAVPAPTINASLIGVGVLPIARGGTGTNAASYVIGAPLQYNGTSFAAIANTGTAGTYANAAYVPVITTDEYGRVSGVTNTAIVIDASAVTSGTLPVSRGGTGNTSLINGTLLIGAGTGAITTLANTGNAATYGNAAYVPVITTDAYGRVSAVTNTAIAVDASAITSGNLAIARGGLNNNGGYTVGAPIQYDGSKFVTLANTGTAGTYGNGSLVPVITTDAYGRVSAVTNTAINATAISTGTLSVARGGTGNTSLINGTILIGAGTNAITTLANTGTAGTYGNAAYLPVVTTDAYGRVSGVTNTAIAVDASAITSGTLGVARGGTGNTSLINGTILIGAGTGAITTLANTGTAATYGNSTFIPVITTDAYGRVSSVTNTAISFSDAIAYAAIMS